MSTEKDDAVTFEAPPPPPPPPAEPPCPPGGSGPRLPLGALLLIALAALPAYGIFQWFFCRIEVEQGKLAVLIAKTGANLPSGRIIAGPEEKGIRLATLGEGRHFRNPLFWDWYLVPIAEVPPGKVGVVTRLFGKEPPSGTVLVEGTIEDTDIENAEKGILREVLRPGRYRLNPMAYALETHEAVEIKPGFVGVVTNLVGTPPRDPNRYVVEAGERGVQKTTLGPGVHYVNPYAVRIDAIDVRQKRLEFTQDPRLLAKTRKEDPKWKYLSDHVAIVFPSSDGFEIEVKLTVTWQVDEKRAPEAFVRIGKSADVARYDDDVVQIVLTPAIRGYARIEGSKFEATQYISGASRTTFQNALLEKVRAACAPKGILIHEVLVSDIEPPAEIADPIRQREIAKEELARNLNQIKQAQAEQTLARQTALVAQERARVESETKKIQQVITAKNRQEVAMIDQEKLLMVARTDLEAAKLEASAILSRGQAEADVIHAKNEAEAEALKRAVEAFRSPAAFAAYTFATRVAPSVRGVFADPASPFGRLFTEMIEPVPGGGASPSPSPGPGQSAKGGH